MNKIIGTMKESSLHASLKSRYASPDDELEVVVQKYHIDIVTEKELIEIQTGNFSNLKKKLDNLLPKYVVRIVFPLVHERWIVRVEDNLDFISRRKSPRKGSIFDLFNELVFIADLFPNPNLILEAVMVKDEIYYINDQKGSWRRKGWSVYDRRLLEILAKRIFFEPSDFLGLFPESLSETFTVQQLADQCQVRKRLSSRIAYSLFHMGVLERIGKHGNAWVYKPRS